MLVRCPWDRSSSEAATALTSCGSTMRKFSSIEASGTFCRDHRRGLRPLECSHCRVKVFHRGRFGDEMLEFRLLVLLFIQLENVPCEGDGVNGVMCQQGLKQLTAVSVR